MSEENPSSITADDITALETAGYRIPTPHPTEPRHTMFSKLATRPELSTPRIRSRTHLRQNSNTYLNSDGEVPLELTVRRNRF